ncbi:hypothetical protein EHS25_005581 [Saitozyma podzolica]|uniref:SHSP domain-containing protein n=1 Tax=Saitozyma podzolica TaxID=1890683 RepID=A0A427XY16_9TREE|nr:hypothetical protein EHS25_005581 [Saitozyma podzolica]
MALARLFFDNDTDFDRMLSARMPTYFPSSSSTGWVDRFTPKFDIVQKDDNVTVLAELPGVKKEDVKVDLTQDGRLTISGTTKEEKEYQDEADVTHRERSFGSFSRSISVPTGIKASEIRASMEHGLLKVLLPTKPKEPATAQITIT